MTNTRCVNQTKEAPPVIRQIRHQRAGWCWCSPGPGSQKTAHNHPPLSIKISNRPPPSSCNLFHFFSLFQACISQKIYWLLFVTGTANWIWFSTARIFLKVKNKKNSVNFAQSKFLQALPPPMFSCSLQPIAISDCFSSNKGSWKENCDIQRLFCELVTQENRNIGSQLWYPLDFLIILSFFQQCPEKWDENRWWSASPKWREKIAPVSPHQLINHFANVFVKSHAVWISNRFATNMFVVNFATTFFHIPVCLSHLRPVPAAQMIINHFKIGNFRKILAPVEISIPRVVWPESKAMTMKRKENVEGGCQRCMPRMRLSNL